MSIKILKYKCVVSTNNKAITMIKQNKISPTIIIAQKQTNGRGRYGNKWISSKGNLFMTLFFEINKRKSIKKLTVENCKIVKKTIFKFIKKTIKIKKPNDLLVENKKLCGILQETLTHNSKKYIIIGIGINLIKSPVIKNYPTTYMGKFIRKRINKSLIYNDIKRKYEKKFSI